MRGRGARRRTVSQAGRFHKRTIMPRPRTATAAFLPDYAREVAGVLGAAGIAEVAFTRELTKALARQRRASR